MSRRSRNQGMDRPAPGSKMEGTRLAQSKNWTFTFFPNGHYDVQYGIDRFYEIAELEKTSVAACAFGLETCPDTNREHLQGFLQTYKKSMSSAARRGSRYSITREPLLAC